MSDILYATPEGFRRQPQRSAGHCKSCDTYIPEGWQHICRKMYTSDERYAEALKAFPRPDPLVTEAT